MNWKHVSIPPPIGFWCTETCYNRSINVLIFCKGDNWTDFVVGYCDKDGDEPLRWHTSCSSNWNITETATHWIWLPEAP